MIKHNQSGAVSGLLVSLILTVILLLAAVGFGAWAFSSRQDYKNNDAAKAKVVADAAVAKNTAAMNAKFTEELKNPLATYNGPETLGSLVLKYPKNWSVYNNSPSDGSGVDLYFNPVMVQAVGNAQTPYALHVKIANQNYVNMVQGLNGDQKAVVGAYALPSLPKVVGVKASGQLPDGSTGTLVILPIRSDTLTVQTYTNKYINDFNNYILKNLDFSP